MHILKYNYAATIWSSRHTHLWGLKLLSKQVLEILIYKLCLRTIKNRQTTKRQTDCKTNCETNTEMEKDRSEKKRTLGGYFSHHPPLTVPAWDQRGRAALSHIWSKQTAGEVWQHDRDISHRCCSILPYCCSAWGLQLWEMMQGPETRDTESVGISRHTKGADVKASLLIWDQCVAVIYHIWHSHGVHDSVCL